MELNFFLIIFIILLIFLAIYLPISGYVSVKKMKQSFSEGVYDKIKFYLDTIIWSWIPVALVILLIPFSGVEVSDLGIKWIAINNSLNVWLLYPGIVIYVLYLAYTIYAILLYKNSKVGRQKASKNISVDFQFFLPRTSKEKDTWSWLSISAGVTEELVYRGYMFYALGVVFPELSILHILLISTLIFGMGHIYLGKEVIKSAFLGLMFGSFYIIFDSVFPIMILHATQDLMMRDITDEEYWALTENAKEPAD